ncbi:hypothetical protein JW930_06925 [Candidatus Woesearchaeota archaeon]|nr:hypothetical protein [Candidatus Woesearchaeota archaeon]
MGSALSLSGSNIESLIGVPGPSIRSHNLSATSRYTFRFGQEELEAIARELVEMWDADYFEIPSFTPQNATGQEPVELIYYEATPFLYYTRLKERLKASDRLHKMLSAARDKEGEEKKVLIQAAYIVALESDRYLHKLDRQAPSGSTLIGIRNMLYQARSALVTELGLEALVPMTQYRDYEGRRYALRLRECAIPRNGFRDAVLLGEGQDYRVPDDIKNVIAIEDPGDPEQRKEMFIKAESARRQTLPGSHVCLVFYTILHQIRRNNAKVWKIQE